MKKRETQQCEINRHHALDLIVIIGKGEQKWIPEGGYRSRETDTSTGQGTRPLGVALILRSNRLNSFESFSNPLSLLPPTVVSPAEVEVETFLASCLSNR